MRGIAILMVVAGHATLILRTVIAELGVDAGIGVQLTGMQSGFLQPIRMPMFTFLSGWVYALRPVTYDMLRPFITGKIRRILIPLIVVSTLTYFFHLATETGYPEIRMGTLRPVKPGEFWLVPLYHFRHFWFLQALLSIFAIMVVIDLTSSMRTTRQWLLWLIVAALAYSFVSGTQFFSLRKVPDIWVFFIAGVGANRFRSHWENKNVLKILWLLFVVAMVAHVVWKLTDEVFDPRIHFLMIGIIAPICLINLNFVWTPLVWIGGYSYAIYLFHDIGMRLVPWLDRLNETELGQCISFAVTMTLGVALPILIDFVARRIPYVRTALVGRRP